MSRRLQVLVDEREWREIERAAKGSHQTVSAWVRQVLRESYSRRPTGQPKKKLAAIRAASQYAFPAPEIEQMNSEIAAGYAEGLPE